MSALLLLRQGNLRKLKAGLCGGTKLIRTPIRTHCGDLPRWLLPSASIDGQWPGLAIFSGPKKFAFLPFPINSFNPLTTPLLFILPHHHLSFFGASRHISSFPSL